LGPVYFPSNQRAVEEIIKRVLFDITFCESVAAPAGKMVQSSVATPFGNIGQPYVEPPGGKIKCKSY